MFHEKFTRASASPLYEWLIFDIYQVQPAGRSGGPSGRAVACRQNAGDVVRFQCSFSHKHECSHQIADHVVQKTAASNGISQFFLFVSMAPGRSEDLSDI